MNTRYGRNKRKAISPVLATVILIAITLIAAIAIAGFVFGLFGSFTSSANVSAAVVSCTTSNPGGAGTVTCVLSATNSGTANTNALSCSFKYGGNTYTATTATTTLTAGKSTTVTCASSVATLPDPGAGNAITGFISTSNGASVPFTGTAAN